MLFHYIAEHCEKILDPYYGEALCNGDVVGRKCQFTCYEGFKLSGPRERICQADGTWSGKNTKCLRKFKTLDKLLTVFLLFFRHLKIFCCQLVFLFCLRYSNILILVLGCLFRGNVSYS